MKRKPIIGIGPHYVTNPDGKPIIGCYEAYIRGIEKAGGTALILTAQKSLIPNYLEMIDGLMLTGGDDMEPRYFGERKLPGLVLEKSPDERSEFDLEIIRQALKMDMPFFGICLGCQSLNVAFGGNLYQDLPMQKPEAIDHKKDKHPAIISQHSKLEKILGRQKISVNTNHHQSVRELGQGIDVSAYAPDGVIEAIEHTASSYALGIQWHPETLLKTKVSQNLFGSFIKASKNFMRR